MPRHVDELRDGEPFPIKPGTNEHEALSFLLNNRDYGFTPTEIADRTTISEASASKTMIRLFDKGLVDRSQGMYYADPDRADDLKRRLDSLDAAVRLHQSVPDDDAYAEHGWEEDVSSIDPDQNRDPLPTETAKETDPTDEAPELVGRLVGEESGE
jgi:DNA-binding transcriptional ArsR family regulator